MTDLASDRPQHTETAPPDGAVQPGASAAPPTPPPRRAERRVGTGAWSSRDILRAGLLIAGLYVALRLLWFANDLVLITFIGILFGLALSAGVDRLQRFRVPRGVGAAFIALSFFAILYGIGALMAPTISAQASELKAKLPVAVERVEGWLHQHGVFRVLLEPDTTAPRQPAPGEQAAPAGAGAGARDTTATASASPLREGLSRQLRSATRYLFPFLTSTVAVLAGLLVILFVAIYVAADPELYHRGLMHLFPHHMRPLAGQVLSETALVLRRWLLTQLIAMAVIAAVTTIVLLILRVKAPFVLGIIAGLLEFIPTIGPILSAVPAIAMGFLDSPEKALSVTIAYIAIQQLEGHILIPLLMKGGMNLPPVLTILSQALMALVFGFLGLMVAVPLLAAVLVPIKMLYVERVVGDDVELLSDTVGTGGG